MSLIPPESFADRRIFTKKGDVYVCDKEQEIQSLFFFSLVFWLDFD